VPNSDGPLPRWMTPLSWLLARGYARGVAWRNARFDAGRGVATLEAAGVRIPLISVGNLTAGGTGKSPFVAWSARHAAEEGAFPLIALRGYRATAHSVAEGSSTPRLRSDEAEEYAVSAPMARVVVGKRRAELLIELLRAPTSDAWRHRALVILDDGFQHRQLRRDLDVVLVDATRLGLDGDVLPNGWLREPARNIKRADVVVVTKAHDAAQRARAAEVVTEFRGCPPDAVCEHVWDAVDVLAPMVERDRHAAFVAMPMDWLRGKRVLSACALGNPQHFHAMVARATGLEPTTLERGDHVAFTAEELERAAKRACVDIVVMSRKDVVKLEAQPELTIVVPQLSIRFTEGEERVRDAISAARQTVRGW
jgi:tetraacyldisaccharide 4'-kinase